METTPTASWPGSGARAGMDGPQVGDVWQTATQGSLCVAILYWVTWLARFTAGVEPNA